MSKKHASMPIDTFLSTQTSYSRREIFKFIQAGEVTVNGHVIHSINHIIHHKIDIIKIGKERVTFQTKLVYYKFNKPKNVISTYEDPKGRVDLKRFVSDLPESIFPVGRLDRHTKGLLLFTNDGDLAHHILHPSFKLTKTYDVVLDKPLTNTHLKRLKSGFFLDDGPVRFDSIVKYSDIELKVTISEGRNRIIRRSFDFFGYTVIKLFRLSIGPISLGAVKEGELKPLSSKELRDLKTLFK